MLDTMLFDLERAENDANTTQQQRGRIKELHIDMSRDYALLYPKYEAARQNKITMKRPSAQDFQKVSALSDQVEIYIKGNKATSDAIQIRSEEHTSELQSLMRISYADFCLKQKTKIKQ